MILDLFKRKPHFILLIVSLFFLFISFFQSEDSTLDINVHDTYFVIPHSFVHQCIFVIAFGVFCLYWAFDKINFCMKEILSKIHIYITSFSFIGICYPLIFVFPYFFENSIDLLIWILFFLLLFAQLIFFTNFGIGVFNLIRKKTS